ncbi:MAG: hypothetical protein ACI4SO_08265 [Muribaculaceae bacterium]
MNEEDRKLEANGTKDAVTVSAQEGDKTGTDSTADKVMAAAAEGRLTDSLDGQIRTTEDWLSYYNKPESAEKRAARERRERSRRIVSAVSDGLRAIGNMYFTTQYAPNMYDANNTMLGATDARIEKLRAAREKNDDAYMRLALKKDELTGKRAATELELAHQKAKEQREAKEAEYKRKADEREDELFPYKKTKAENDAAASEYRAGKSESDAQTSKAIAENAQRQQELKNEEAESRIACNNRSNRDNKNSNGGRGSGSKGGKKVKRVRTERKAKGVGSYEEDKEYYYEDENEGLPGSGSNDVDI